ncbi:MAG: long-chain fatty acid--CoA ligase [Spirochaetes bacterium]|nr:long-chain fatty acid--CoA ligase [Spirochaetota bacterium]
MKKDYNKEFHDFLEKEKTLAVMMLKRSREFAPHPALRFMRNGAWESLAWGDFGERIRAAAMGLLDLGVPAGAMVSIFSQNRPEWAIADLGILSIRGVTVPVYATNSADETEYIVRDASVSIIFTGDQVQYDRARSVMNKVSGLARIIAFDRDTTISGPESMYFDDLLALGRASEKAGELEKRLAEVESDDMLTLIYTSGTTGQPKGAIHTHKSFMAGIFPSMERFPEAGPGSVSLAILPLSHVFERMWSYGCMIVGGEIAYCPDPKKFVEVMHAVRPQYLTSVPRLWEKVYGTINEGLKKASPIKRRLFTWSLETGRAAYRARKAGMKNGITGAIKLRIAKTLVIDKAQKALGCERNRVYHVGGAAFAREINEFFQALGINIVQGFGLTEFFPVAVGYNDHGKVGACGPIIPMVDVRISDEGEIQLKGLNCMKGYFNKPEETGAVFTEDGWFRTGDVGRVEGDKHRYIVITDRIKDLLITAGGKNISPQQIELLLGDDLMIEQAVAIGDGKKFISALIVPAYPLLEAYARGNGIPFSSRDDLAGNPDIIKFYEERVAERTKSLGQVEKIKKIRILTEELSQESGELTPTMKIRRKLVNEKYRDLINDIYRE